MKTIKLLATAFFGLALGSCMVSCSEDDVPSGAVKNDDYHFDLIMSVGGTTGMTTKDITATIIRSVSVKDIEDPDYVISMKGQGTDITEILNSEAVIKGAYYYEACPRKNTYYGKYNITELTMEESRFPIGNITLMDRQYAHTWTSDNTLVLIGADRTVSSRGANKALTNTIQWVCLNDNGSLEIAKEGTFNLTKATESFKKGGITAFSTSGLAKYRKSDNTIIYFFVDKATEGATKGVFVAFIDAETMEIKSVALDSSVDEMCGTSYGELGQDKVIIDENDDIYIPCGTKVENAVASSAQTSKVLRIKNGEYDFDKNYAGASNINAKIVSADYLGNGKAIIYATDPVKAGLSTDLASSTTDNWNQNEFNGFYYVYDLESGDVKDLNIDSAPNCGTFSDRVAVFNGKAYIGTCPKEPAKSCIYIYDIKSERITKGATIESGYYFNRISILSNK